MAILFTDETALEYWRWRAWTGTVLNRPKRCRLTRLPESPSTPSDIRAAAETFHRSDEPLHVLTLSCKSKRIADDIKFHFHKGAFPDGAFCKINNGLYVASPEFVFLKLACKLDILDLIVLGYEITGTYYIPEDPEENTRGFNTCDALCSLRRLRNFIDRSHGIKGYKKAFRACRYVLGHSASPMETEVAMLMTLPKFMGGYGLEKPRLNHPIRLSDEQKSELGRNLFKVDMFWPDKNTGLEYESTRWHSGDEKFIADSQRRNDLRFLGYDITTLTYKECSSILDMDRFCETLRKKLRLKTWPDPPDYQTRKISLRTKLKDIRNTAKENDDIMSDADFYYSDDEIAYQDC